MNQRLSKLEQEENRILLRMTLEKEKCQVILRSLKRDLHKVTEKIKERNT